MASIDRLRLHWVVDGGWWKRVIVNGSGSESGIENAFWNGNGNACGSGMVT